MRLSLRSLFSQPKTIRNRKQIVKIRLGLESLEERALMDAGLAGSALLVHTQQTDQAGQIQLVSQVDQAATSSQNLLSEQLSKDILENRGTIPAQMVDQLKTEPAKLVESLRQVEQLGATVHQPTVFAQARVELQTAIDAHAQQSAALERLDAQIQQVSQTLAAAEQTLADKSAAIAGKDAAVQEANKSTLTYQEQLVRRTELTNQVSQARIAYDNAVRAQRTNRRPRLNASLSQQVRVTKASLDSLSRQLRAQNVIVQNADLAMKGDALALQNAVAALDLARKELADAVAFRDQTAQSLADLQVQREQVIVAQEQATAQIADIMSRFEPIVNTPEYLRMQAVQLDRDLGLYAPTNLYENWGGKGEKWVLGAGGQWYFILPTGELHRWDGGGATGELVARLDASFFENINTLVDASRLFGRLEQDDFTIVAAQLDRDLGLHVVDDPYANWGGQNEMWLQGAANEWYYILPTGALHRWDGSATASGEFVAMLDSSYHLDMSKLVEAEQRLDSLVTLGLIDASSMTQAGESGTKFHTFMANKDADGYTNEYPQGIKVLANTYNRAQEKHEQADITSFLTDKQDTYLRDMLDNEWNGKTVKWDVLGQEFDTGMTVRQWAQEDMKIEVERAIAKAGFTSYDREAHLDDKGDYSFKQLGQNRFEIRYRLTDTWMKFKVEVPTGIRETMAVAAGLKAVQGFLWNPVQAAAVFALAYDSVMSIDDPRFTARFDLEMVVQLYLAPELDATNANNLKVSKAEVNIVNAHLYYDNFFADLTKAVVDIVGGDGMAAAERAMADGKPGAFGPAQLNAAFAGLNASLQKAAESGYTQLATRVVDEGPAGKLVLELTQDIPRMSLHLTAKNIGTTMSGTAQEQSLVKTYVAISMDGRELKAMESQMFNPDIRPWVRDASLAELDKLKLTGTNFGMDFDVKGQHTIRVEIWRSVRREEGVAIPPGVTIGLVAGWDLVYDFKTQKITGAFGTANLGEEIVLTSTGEAPATVTIVIGEDVAGKWNPKREEAPIPPLQEVEIIPELNPEPDWEPRWDDFQLPPWLEQDWDLGVIQPDLQIRDGIFEQLDRNMLDAAIINIGEDVLLNPQPLPPKVFDESIRDAAIVSIADDVSLNPQPLPPKLNVRPFRPSPFSRVQVCHIRRASVEVLTRNIGLTRRRN